MTKREDVVKRAAEMFAEFGVKSVRMDDVARDLAISKRTLYELFADKQELLYYGVKHLFATEAEQIMSRVNIKNGGIPALFEIFDMMAKSAPTRQRIMENLQKFYPELFVRIMTENRDYGLATLRDQINNLVEQGLVSMSVNVDLSVTMFYYTSTGLMRRQGRLVLPEGVTEADAFRYTIINFFRGIATLKGVEQIDNYLAEKAEKR